MKNVLKFNDFIFESVSINEAMQISADLKSVKTAEDLAKVVGSKKLIKPFII